MSIQIHATLGPASSTDSVIEQLLQAGVDVFRINLSHCSPEELSPLVEQIRFLERKLSKPVRIIPDIRGRKLRLGPHQDDELVLTAGQAYVLHGVPEGEELPGNAREAWVNHPRLAAKVEPGATILLDDGALSLKAEAVKGMDILCRVEIAGPLPSRSSLNVPGIPSDLPPIGPKDLHDLDAVARLSIDGVYLSHVEWANDVDILRRALQERNLSVPIVAKIERRLAVDNLDSIIAVADAICLARGDLGVEVPLGDIPSIQRRTVARTHAAGKPFILAGELFYSLVTRQIPARAELTDLFTALEQGADGFILSDETAVGIAPVNAVQTLIALIREMSVHLLRRSLICT